MFKKIVLSVVVVAVIVAVAWAVWHFYFSGPASQQPNAVNTTAPAASTSSQSLSVGAVKIFFPGSEFTVASTSSQVAVVSYIPPCDFNFNYCLYYTGQAYKGTNFESAGIRVQQRPDLSSETNCLLTEPTGYSNLMPQALYFNNYSTSVFDSLGDAGAGHYSNGSLYRLFYNNQCYEFQTRIGQTQFANYPPGAIEKFTTEDQSTLQGDLQQIINSVTLDNGTRVSFPSTSTSSGS